MVKKIINSFKNESDCLQIGDLTIENRIGFYRWLKEGGVLIRGERDHHSANTNELL